MRPLLVPVLGAAILGLACAGREPGCDLSAGGLRLVFEVDGGGAAPVGDTVKQRVEAMGGCADVRVDGAEITVDLVGELNPGLRTVLHREGHLRIRPAIPAVRAAELDARVPEGASHDQLRAWLAASRAGLPAGVDALLEPPDSGNPPGVLFVPAGGGLADPEIADAEVVAGELGHRVVVTLAEPSATAFAELTAANVGERLVIDLDGEVLVAAVVQERLHDGVFSIHPGPATPDPEAWLQRLAALLRARPLGSRITLVSESVFGPSAP